jgi:nitrate/nitrite-specific signal transduction histidine kinase
MPFGIRWRSLRTRIILFSFVPTVIILMIVAYVTFYAYQNVAEDLVVQRNQELARLSAGQLGNGLAEYTDILAGVARTLGLTGEDPAQRRQILADARYRSVVFDGGVIVLDNFGKVLDSEPARPEIVGQDWSGRAYFRQMLRTRSPVFSNVSQDGPGGTPVVAVAVPVTGPRGELQGTLAGMFRLDATAVSAFYGGILKLRLGESGNIWVVDGNGQVIYHPDRSRIGTDVANQPAVQQLLSKGAGSLRGRDSDGEEIVAGFATIPSTPWGLISEETRAALLAPSEGYRRFLLILLVLGVVVPTLFVTFGVGRITQPIVEVTAAARQIAAGNFDQTINPRTGDELEALAAQFNVMSAQLQESYANLERRVADRTRDLAALNALAAAVSQSLDIEDIMDEALARTLDVTGLEVGVAYRVDEQQPDAAEGDGNYLTLIAYRGVAEETARQASHMLVNDGAAGTALQRLAPAYVPVSAYPDSSLRKLIEREGVQMVISTPLAAKNRVLGFINIGSREPRVVTGDELALLAGIGQQVGMALENARLYEKAEEVAAQAERSRLARDLHDAVTQTLFSASLIADVLPKLWERNPEEGRRRLEELRQLTRGALAEMRTLLLELRPSALMEAALSDLLRQLGESVTGRARVAVAVKIDGQGPEGLTPDVKVGLYRIAQEALNNVAKHSGASNAWVNLSYGPEGVLMSIEDDGRGFDPASVPPNHLGLGIMQERAAAIGAVVVIESEPGAGTHIDVVWQCPKDQL